LLLSLPGPLLTRSAAAQPQNFQFGAPVGCGSREEIDAGIERITSKPLAELLTRGVRVALQLTRGGKTWSVRLVFTGADGTQQQRAVTASSCEDAMNAATVVLATSLAQGMELSPKAEQPKEAQPEEQKVTQTATRTTSPPRPPAASRERSRASRPRRERAAGPLRLSAAASFGADLGWLPAPLAHLTLSGGIRRRDVALSLFFAATSSATLELAGPTETAQVSLLLGGAELCTRLVGHRPSVRACANLELGRFHARGDQVSGPKSQNALWSAGGLTLGMDWPLSEHFALQVGLTGLLAFQTYDIVAEPGFGYRTAQVAARSKLGLRWEL
jgi:hypothetical protein